MQVIWDDIFIHVTSNAVCASHLFPHSTLAAIPQFHSRLKRCIWRLLQRVFFWADWQLRPLEKGVKVKGVVCRLVSLFVDTHGSPCLLETWTDEALYTWYGTTFSFKRKELHVDCFSHIHKLPGFPQVAFWAMQPHSFWPCQYVRIDQKPLVGDLVKDDHWSASKVQWISHVPGNSEVSVQTQVHDKKGNVPHDL